MPLQQTGLAGRFNKLFFILLPLAAMTCNCNPPTGVKMNRMAADPAAESFLITAEAGTPPVVFVSALPPAKSLIEDFDGNRHLTAVEVSDDFLILYHSQDAPETYFTSRVPWSDIFRRKVRYGIPEFYGRRVRELPSAVKEHGGVKIESHRIRINVNGRERVLQLPKNHTVIDADLFDSRSILVATNSDQGDVDGELLAPLVRTQLFIVRLP